MSIARRRAFACVEPAVLEIVSPTIDDSFARLIKHGADHVVVHLTSSRQADILAVIFPWMLRLRRADILALPIRLQSHSLRIIS